jgi:predicted permease
MESIWRKARMFFARDRHYRELTEEMEAHAELKARALHEDGLSEEAARMAARREMGPATLAMEQSRDHWSFTAIENCVQDIRYALRILRKNPSFTLTAILSLALGIAGSTAIFAFVNALLVRPLPYPDSARLVRITNFYPKALLVYFQQRCRTIDLASIGPGTEFNVTGLGPAFRITASSASGNFFAVLGATAERGRTFEPGEDRPGKDDVVILSHALWTSRFGADAGAIGRSFTVNGRDRRIIGVMPAAFAFPSSLVQAWIPAPLNPTVMEEYWAGDFVPLVARLRPGATIEQARAEIHSLAAGVWTLFPFPMPRHWNGDSTVISLQTDLAGESRTRLLLLFGAVAAVLAIGSVNVAGLLLARAGGRGREIALRVALGAKRLRIVRQLLTESVVLAGAAGVIGLALGVSALSLFRPVIARGMPGAAQIGVDGSVAGFAAALALLTGLAFGMVPAINAVRMNLFEVVKTGGRGSATRTWVRLRAWLISGEIAFTVVLVAGASLLIASLYGLSQVNPGFRAERVLAMKISPDASFCTQRAACVAFYWRTLDAARGVAGVSGVAMANTVPFDGELPSLPVDVEGHPKSADFPAPMFWAGAVSPEYLDLMEIPLEMGRTLSPADAAESAPVILVTASTAKRFWPGENPIGKHVKSVLEAKWRTVVGVVADVHQFDLSDRAPSTISGAMYLPYSQSLGADGRIPAVMNLVVRTAADRPGIGDALHQVAAANSPNVPVGRAAPIEGLVNDSVSNFRSTTWIFLSFAGVALLLAAIGVYGMVSYSVTQRTFEISLRIAIGASTGNIVRMILTEGLWVILAGTTAGLAAAWFLTRSLSSLLYGVKADDPRIFAAVALLLTLVAAAASAIPAWRASRIDPIHTLRSE